MKEISSINVTPSKKTFTFLETHDGSRVNGWEFIKWMGYDEGTKFISSEENKYIGYTDRSDCLLYPDGIQENDVISLHNGEVTKITKLTFPMTHPDFEDWHRYGWWFINESINHESEEFKYLKGSSDLIAIGYLGMEKN